MKLTEISFFRDYPKSIKVSDTEEYYDLVFSRPFGYVFAKWLHALGFNPNGISYLGMFTGALGGFLLYWQDRIDMTITAFILVTLAGVLDSSDGQAARLYNQKSLNGRVLDAIVDNVVFFSCYLFALLHFLDEHTFFYLFMLGIIGGGAHSVKSNIYEYYKGMYAFYSHSDRGQRNPEPEELAAQWEQSTFIRRVVFVLYKDYLKKQKQLRFRKQQTIDILDQADKNNPEKTAEIYRKYNKHILSLWAWTSGSNIMRNGILISSLLGRFDIYCYINTLSLIPYFLVGWYQNKQDAKVISALKEEGIV